MRLKKPSRTARKKEAHAVRAKRRLDEDREKAKVRRRDRSCRFPLCGCAKLKLPLEVSHNVHKGIGGDPTGERSKADQMIYLCAHRHQHGEISRHKGTVRVRALTDAGMNGPVAWDIDLREMRLERPGSYEPGPAMWFEVALERGVQQFEPLTKDQLTFLKQLAEMEL
jgi:hypothetical protein